MSFLSFISLVIGAAALAGMIYNLLTTDRLKSSTENRLDELRDKVQDIGQTIKVFENTLIAVKDRLSDASASVDALKLSSRKSLEDLSQELSGRIEETKRSVLSQSQEVTSINVKIISVQTDIDQAKVDLASIKVKIGI